MSNQYSVTVNTNPLPSSAPPLSNSLVSQSAPSVSISTNTPYSPMSISASSSPSPYYTQPQPLQQTGLPVSSYIPSLPSTTSGSGSMYSSIGTASPQLQMPSQYPSTSSPYASPYSILPAQLQTGGVGVPHRLATKGYNASLPLCSMILTVHTGSSYDPLYRQVMQEPPSAEVAISLWELNYTNLPALYAALAGEKFSKDISDPELKAIREIQSDMEKTHPSSVLLNFECCAGCSNTGWPQISGGEELIFKLIRLFLDRCSYVQFGDFSTRALINTWPRYEHLLGPNPLIEIGRFSSNFDLRFNPMTLIDGPSVQLKKVGELCREKGGAHLHAMGGTVMFTVDLAKTDTSHYQYQLLTVMTKADGNEITNGREKVKFKDVTYTGAAGHVVFKYKSNKSNTNTNTNTAQSTTPATPSTSTTASTTPAAGSSSSASSASSSASASGSGSSSSSSSQLALASGSEEGVGYMLVSAGHWIELSRLDTDVDAVRTQMAVQYGETEANNFMAQYNALPVAAQAGYMQSHAARIVHSNASSSHSRKY